MEMRWGIVFEYSTLPYGIPAQALPGYCCNLKYPLLGQLNAYGGSIYTYHLYGTRNSKRWLHCFAISLAKRTFVGVISDD